MCREADNKTFEYSASIENFISTDVTSNLMKNSSTVKVTLDEKSLTECYRSNTLPVGCWSRESPVLQSNYKTPIVNTALDDDTVIDDAKSLDDEELRHVRPSGSLSQHAGRSGSYASLTTASALTSGRSVQSSLSKGTDRWTPVNDGIVKIETPEIDVPKFTPPTCDACIYCDDVCANQFCRVCLPKKRRLSKLSSQASSGLYTMCQVKRHKSKGDCWLVAHGSVYDVSAILDVHPAGSECILKKAGTDCTIDFDFHSRITQREMWSKLRQGKCVSCRGSPEYEPKRSFCVIS